MHSTEGEAGSVCGRGDESAPYCAVFPELGAVARQRGNGISWVLIGYIESSEVCGLSLCRARPRDTNDMHVAMW